MHLGQSDSETAQFALLLLQAEFLFWLCTYESTYFGFFCLKYFISCSWILSNAITPWSKMETMAQFWYCLPHGQCTETSHFLTFCPHFHQLMRNKRVVSEEDPEIGHFSRESYYTSIQSPFLNTFSLLSCQVQYILQYPFFPSPKSCEHQMLPTQMFSVLSTVPSGEADT